MADVVRDEMARVTTQLQNELQTMNTNVMKTLADWEDSAKDAYEVARQQWEAAAARMPQSLYSAETTLAQITDGYLKVEHAGQNAWGGYTVK